MIRRPPRSTLFPTPPLFRSFFEPLALAYALAVGAAMVVALTVTPALALLVFQRGSAVRREPPLLGRLRGRYAEGLARDRKSTRLNSSHANISYAVFCLKKKK